jgi:predicted PurR-regulated permease PerM
MQRPNLRLVERRKKPSGSGSSEWLDAWVWAERISVIGLFTLAVGYTLFVAQELFVPVVTAWVMGAILRPIVEAGERLGVPRVVGVIASATVAVLILLAIIGLLSTPLVYWIGRTHELAQLMKEKLQLLNQLLAIFDEIAHALSGVSGTEPASSVHYDTSTIVRGIVSTLTPVITQFLLFFFAMIFWMLYANEVKGGIAHLFSDDRAREVAHTVLDSAEHRVSQYFGTLLLVNLCLALVAMGLAMAVGLPNPLLWGVLAGTLNFIPYLGPAIMVATLFLIGLFDFSDSQRCARPADHLDFGDDFGGAIHYTHDHWTPPIPKSFPCFFVDCLLGLDVGPLGRISRRPAGHFRRCPAATSFFVLGGSLPKADISASGS